MEPVIKKSDDAYLEIFLDLPVCVTMKCLNNLNTRCTCGMLDGITPNVPSLCSEFLVSKNDLEKDSLNV